MVSYLTSALRVRSSPARSTSYSVTLFVTWNVNFLTFDTPFHSRPRSTSLTPCLSVPEAPSTCSVYTGSLRLFASSSFCSSSAMKSANASALIFMGSYLISYSFSSRHHFDSLPE